jgi:periplasmic divalent cation tolerance protein
MARSDGEHLAGGEYLQVQTTTDSRAEAIELARAAVEARLAACGQVAGPVASTYWWNDELERSEEWFVFLKLPADRYDQLAAFLTERHSYDEPEIVATAIVAGSPSFLGWIRDETRLRPAAAEAATEPEAGSGEAVSGEAGSGEAVSGEALEQAVEGEIEAG